MVVPSWTETSSRASEVLIELSAYVKRMRTKALVEWSPRAGHSSLSSVWFIFVALFFALATEFVFARGFGSSFPPQRCVCV